MHDNLHFDNAFEIVANGRIATRMNLRTAWNNAHTVYVHHKGSRAMKVNM